MELAGAIIIGCSKIIRGEILRTGHLMQATGVESNRSSIYEIKQSYYS